MNEIGLSPMTLLDISILNYIYNFLITIINDSSNRSIISTIIKICFHPDFKFIIFQILIYSNYYELKYIISKIFIKFKNIFFK